MHDDAFDQAMREGVAGIQRRGFLALAATLAALTVTRPDVDARRRRRRKRKKCKSGTTKCGKQCVNLNTDNVNCGACAVACSGGTVCNEGACACPVDQSFVAGACIPKFGCTVELDTCAVGKKACPALPSDADSRCHVSAEGEPFCATAEECVSVPNSSDCPTIGGKSRILIPCANCADPGETGQCVLPVTEPGNNP